MENINIAELLRNSPKGTKLYSPIFGDVYLDKIKPHLAVVVTIRGIKEEFLYDGRYSIDGECMLFPSKENRDWSTFGISFNDGDIVATGSGTWIGITTGGKADKFIPTYCVIKWDDTFEAYFDRKETWAFNRLATEEEKQKLFAAIKANGYKWNAETKTLEKLVEPKFKRGDKIKKKDSDEDIVLITDITDDYYIVETKYGMEITISINIQKNYELVTDKFDINTLKPFDKVLVRDNDKKCWFADIYSHYLGKDKIYQFQCIGMTAKQCITYKNNEHLLGTTNDCDDYYKTWE